MPSQIEREGWKPTPLAHVVLAKERLYRERSERVDKMIRRGQLVAQRLDGTEPMQTSAMSTTGP